MTNFIRNSLLLLCVFQHSQADYQYSQINVNEDLNGIFEYSSPNYPNDYGNNLDLVKTVNLQDSTNSGFIIEIIDFEIEKRSSGGCYDYLQIEPLSTIDNTEVSTLVASVESFYNTQICGDIGSYSSNGLPVFQVGDTIRLPNLSSFNIIFGSDGSVTKRGWKIKVYVFPPDAEFCESNQCNPVCNPCVNGVCVVGQQLVLSNPRSSDGNYYNLCDNDNDPSTCYNLPASTTIDGVISHGHYDGFFHSLGEKIYYVDLPHDQPHPVYVNKIVVFPRQNGWYDKYDQMIVSVDDYICTALTPTDAVSVEQNKLTGLFYDCNGASGSLITLDFTLETQAHLAEIQAFGPFCSCNEGWGSQFCDTSSDDVAFQLFTQPKSWYEARDACAALGIGYSLAAITNSIEADTIQSLGGVSAWIGANDINSEGIWQWIRGPNRMNQEIAYSKWANGEPNDYANGEDCADKRAEGLWNDRSCQSNLAYICQYRKSHTCASDPCINGICNDGTDFFECNCENGWEGELCDLNIDECASNPCINGSCTDGLDAFTCACDAGWEGEICDIDIDECASNPCVNGSCVDDIDAFTCACDAGWEGELCDFNIDECASNPCVNGSCSDGLDTFICTCDAGWEGEICNINIDECATKPCNNGSCNDGIDTFTCTCNAGWEGQSCDVNINECESNPCVNGVCIDGIASFQCFCHGGWEGELCNVSSSECTSNQCSLDRTLLNSNNQIVIGYTNQCITAQRWIFFSLR